MKVIYVPEILVQGYTYFVGMCFELNQVNRVNIKVLLWIRRCVNIQ
jgi:hypothetical protein